MIPGFLALGRLRGTVLPLLLGLGTAHAASSSTWPQAAHDAALTSANLGETAITPDNVGRLHRLGAVALGNLAVGQATLGAGAAYTCDDLGQLSATDTRTGADRWTSSAISGYCSAAAVDATTVYTTAWRSTSSGYASTLSALDPATGAPRWLDAGPQDPPLPAPSWLTLNTPTLAGDAVVVTSGRSLVSAYDASTGALRWRAETGTLNNQAAVAGGLVFTSTWGREAGGPQNLLFAHRVADGSLAWTQPADESNSEYPAVAAGGRVFLASDSGELRAFDAASGTPSWEAHLPAYVSANLVATPQVVFAVAGGKALWAFGAADGASRWNITLRGSDQFSSNLVLAGNVLYALARDYLGTVRLVAFDARSGKQLLRLDDGMTGQFGTISVAAGRVYVSSGARLRVYVP